MRSAGRVGQDIALLLARLILGFLLGAHGWHRWVGGVGKLVTDLEALGLPQANLIAWGTTVFELVGGILLVFGLATRIVAILVVIQNALIIAWIRWPEGVFVGDGGFELNALMVAIGLLLLAFGAGRTGVDALFRAPRRPVAKAEPIDEADPA